eukprot:c6154_g1_i1.p1 GENE.c6154_g1_i1~~c6154_g1_i1.p1  ORF type:complete len:227 (-),score=36.41 c6154_g1_i1:181-861(-)
MGSNARCRKACTMTANIHCAVVVLGQCLNPDGSIPKTIVLRAQKAADLSKATKSPIIVSGADVAGVGCSEAGVMATVLAQHGISQLDIHADHEAKNTLQNAWNCIAIATKLGCNEIALVTSDFHMPRSLFIFRSVIKQLNVSIAITAHASKSGLQRLRTGQTQDTTKMHINNYTLDMRVADEHRIMGFMKGWMRSLGTNPDEQYKQDAMNQLNELRTWLQQNPSEL